MMHILQILVSHAAQLQQLDEWSKLVHTLGTTATEF